MLSSIFVIVIKVKFPCDLCDAVASSKRNLRGHITRVHNNENKINRELSQNSEGKRKPAGALGIQGDMSELEYKLMGEERRMLKEVKAQIRSLVEVSHYLFYTHSYKSHNMIIINAVTMI